MFLMPRLKDLESEWEKKHVKYRVAVVLSDLNMFMIAIHIFWTSPAYSTVRLELLPGAPSKKYYHTKCC